jgi:hypothetical protein
MPQLDQFTYLTQFAWLCFFYMTFYILLFNDGLPKISRILKLRAHLSAEQPQPSEPEKMNSVVGTNQDVVFRTLNSSISYLNSSGNGAFQWCAKSVDSLNANQLKPMNKTYLRSIGEISLSQLVKNNALEASAPLTFSSRNRSGKELSQVWALRVQKCLLILSRPNKKKRKK